MGQRTPKPRKRERLFYNYKDKLIRIYILTYIHIHRLCFITILFTKEAVMHFPVWLRKLLISAGLEPVLSHIEISCTASYYRQFLSYF